MSRKDRMSVPEGVPGLMQLVLVFLCGYFRRKSGIRRQHPQAYFEDVVAVSGRPSTRSQVRRGHGSFAEICCFICFSVSATCNKYVFAKGKTLESSMVL